MRKILAIVGTVSTVLLTAGCGSGKTMPTLSATTCGIPYTFEVNGKTVWAGSCAGLLPANAPRVTIRLAERFSLRIAHDKMAHWTFLSQCPTTRQSGCYRSTDRRSYISADPSEPRR
jgi:hypothetical protein